MFVAIVAAAVVVRLFYIAGGNFLDSVLFPLLALFLAVSFSWFFILFQLRSPPMYIFKLI